MANGTMGWRCIAVHEVKTSNPRAMPPNPSLERDLHRPGTWPARLSLSSSASRAKRHPGVGPSAQTLGHSKWSSGKLHSERLSTQNSDARMNSSSRLMRRIGNGNDRSSRWRSASGCSADKALQTQRFRPRASRLLPRRLPGPLSKRSFFQGGAK